MTEAQSQALLCAVCGEEVDARMSAECNWCDRRYHLNQRNDVEAKDCGEVWIDEQYLALQFACQDCLSGAAAGPRGTRTAPPRIGDERAAVQRRRYRRRA